MCPVRRKHLLTHLKQKSLGEALKSNPSALGDPVSLKAEKSNNEPTDQDRPSKGKKSLKQVAEDKLKTNPSALGDPVSLKAETSDKAPKPSEEGAKGGSKGSLRSDLDKTAPTPTEGGGKPKAKL